MRLEDADAAEEDRAAMSAESAAASVNPSRPNGPRPDLPLINDLPALLARAAELEAQSVPEHMSAETVRKRANALFLQHMSEIDVTAEIQPDLDKIRAECLRLVEQQVGGSGGAALERMRAARSAMIEAAIDFADAVALLDGKSQDQGSWARAPAPMAGNVQPTERPPEPEARATGSGFRAEPPGFGVETPIPGRQEDFQGQGGAGGTARGGTYSTPPIDASRSSRSPGLSTNFYDLSTADFKKPYGVRRRN